jgi:DNA (cytosine-5)-methyltransferase 1
MQPTWVIIENVDGIGSMEQSDSETVMETETEICQDTEMVLETIRKDLEESGYQSIAIIIPACSVEAPHQRYRYFVVGYSECSRCGGESRRWSDTKFEDRYSGIEVMADTARKQAGRIQQRKISSNTCASCHERGKAACRSAQSGMGGNANGLHGGLYRSGGQEDSSGIFGAFEEIFTALIDQTLWPAGYGAEQYDYEPPRVATGVKNRTNRLKVLGNAIVWQQIFPILLVIKIIEKKSTKGR